MGAWVLAALKDPGRWINQDMGIVTEWLSTRQMAEIASKVTGKTILPMELDPEAFHKTRDAGYDGAEEFYLNFLFFVKVSYERQSWLTVEWTREWFARPEDDARVVSSGSHLGTNRQEQPGVLVPLIRKCCVAVSR